MKIQEMNAAEMMEVNGGGLFGGLSLGGLTSGLPLVGGLNILGVATMPLTNALSTVNGLTGGLTGGLFGSLLGGLL